MDINGTAAPCTAGDRVRLAPVGGSKRSVVVVVDLVNHVDGDTWVIGGYRPSRKWEGDFIGWTSRMVTAADVTPA